MAESTTLYVIPLSHPAYSARLMLQHKGIEHRVVSLVSGLHRPLLRIMGYRRGTVPVLRMGSRRIEGTLEISRALDEIVPEPPLRPADPARRRRLDEVERWGHEKLQPIPRRLYRWVLCRHAGARRELAELNRLPLPGAAAVLMKPVARYYARLSGADDEAVHRDLVELPGLLDRIDGWISEGILGAAELSAADYQIAPCVRLLMNVDDLREQIEGRPAAALALRVAPTYPGSLPPVFPDAWLPPCPAG